MTKAAEKLLTILLARTESPWRPIRQHWREAPAICAARQATLLPATSGGNGNASRWKRDQGSRDALSESGLYRDGVVTPTGRKLARSWTWPFSVHQLTEAVDRIERCVSAGWYRVGQGGA